MLAILQLMQSLMRALKTAAMLVVFTLSFSTACLAINLMTEAECGSVANTNCGIEQTPFQLRYRFKPSPPHSTHEHDQSVWTDHGPDRQIDACEFDGRVQFQQSWSSPFGMIESFSSLGTLL